MIDNILNTTTRSCEPFITGSTPLLCSETLKRSDETLREKRVFLKEISLVSERGDLNIPDHQDGVSPVVD